MRFVITANNGGYQLKHERGDIQRLHTHCIKPKHAGSKSCKLYRKAIERFNEDMDDAVSEMKKKECE